MFGFSSIVIIFYFKFMNDDDDDNNFKFYPSNQIYSIFSILIIIKIIIFIT